MIARAFVVAMLALSAIVIALGLWALAAGIYERIYGRDGPAPSERRP